MPIDLVQTLADLVSIPSVNPMGHAADGPEFFEHRVTDYLENLFRSLDVPYVRQTVAPLRDNIAARLGPAGDDADNANGPIVLFEAHQDTVPVSGMTIEPFTPLVRDGRMYGRGSCDIKGGLAAMLAAFARLAAERLPKLPTIVMASTVNEEHGFSGATALAELWTAKSLIARPPDLAVVAEPTSLDVVVAHKGVVRWRCHTRGRATHSSQPQLGDNAIFRMAPVLAALAQLQGEVAASRAAHPLCGCPTLSVGTIHGGLSVNTVPDRATIEIDRRICPGEDAGEAYRQTIAYVERACGADWPIEHEEPFLTSRALADGPNRTAAERLAAAARQCGASGRIVGVPFGTNASAIAAAGVPCVVFGPGSIDRAHTADEWVPLDEVKLASEVLYRFARSLGQAN